MNIYATVISLVLSTVILGMIVWMFWAFYRWGAQRRSSNAAQSPPQRRVRRRRYPNALPHDVVPYANVVDAYAVIPRSESQRLERACVRSGSGGGSAADSIIEDTASGSAADGGLLRPRLQKAASIHVHNAGNNTTGTRFQDSITLLRKLSSRLVFGRSAYVPRDAAEDSGIVRVLPMEMHESVGEGSTTSHQQWKSETSVRIIAFSGSSSNAYVNPMNSSSHVEMLPFAAVSINAADL